VFGTNCWNSGEQSPGVTRPGLLPLPHFVLHFGLVDHDRNCRLARADPAHLPAFQKAQKPGPTASYRVRADLDFLLDAVDVATTEGGVDDQSGATARS
jgi:hypothetical protein